MPLLVVTTREDTGKQLSLKYHKGLSFPGQGVLLMQINQTHCKNHGLHRAFLRILRRGGARCPGRARAVSLAQGSISPGEWSCSEVKADTENGRKHRDDFAFPSCKVNNFMTICRDHPGHNPISSCLLVYYSL